MKYMLLIYEKPSDFAQRIDAGKQQTYWAGWSSYHQQLKEAGVLVDGAGLQGPHAGKTVTLKGGQRLVQDRPYADTKDQIGGFYVLEVPNLDVALDYAAKCPAAASGAVEVRPYLQAGS
jgi:hypothetical protein